MLAYDSFLRDQGGACLLAVCRGKVSSAAHSAEKERERERDKEDRRFTPARACMHKGRQA
jgi:hypothetical protein